MAIDVRHMSVETIPTTIHAAPVSIAQDRSLRVHAGQIVKTDWIAIDAVVLVCRDRMAVGDVDRAYQKALQSREVGAWPPPVGYWKGGRFCITDGRHEYIARLMLGESRIFVAWIEPMEKA